MLEIPIGLFILLVGITLVFLAVALVAIHLANKVHEDYERAMLMNMEIMELIDEALDLP